MLPRVDDPHDRAAVVENAYAAIEQVVVAALLAAGARVRAITYSHMHRYTLQCPSFTVHNDYTNAGQGLKQAQKVLAGRESECDAALALPFCMVNVWTPLAPVQRDPLAVCRWRDERSLKDMAYPSPAPGLDEWYYLPNMSLGEAVIFKQFDSQYLARDALMPTDPPTAAIPRGEQTQPEPPEPTTPKASVPSEQRPCDRQSEPPPEQSPPPPLPPPASTLRSTRRSAFTLHTSFRHAHLEAVRPPPPPRRSIEYRVLVIEDAHATLSVGFGQTARAELKATARRAAAERAAKAQSKALSNGLDAPRLRETTGMRQGIA